MFNMDGEVIGIVSQILTVSGGSDGLGFAVTSNVARRLLEEKSFWSGLGSHVLSGDLANVFNVPPPGVGLLVQRIAAGSPAELAGLREGTIRARIGDEELIVGGDIVLSIMGISVDRPDYLAAVREAAALARPGQKVEVVVLRGGSIVRLTSTVPALRRDRSAGSHHPCHPCRPDFGPGTFEFQGASIGCFRKRQDRQITAVLWSRQDPERLMDGSGIIRRLQIRRVRGNMVRRASVAPSRGL
jgi:hypothetical protein